MIDHDLKELDEWAKKWLMTFNSDRTEIMLFSNMDIPEFLLQILTNIWELHLAAMPNGIYILKIYR